MISNILLFSAPTRELVLNIATSTDETASIGFSERLRASGQGSVVITTESASESFLRAINNGTHFIALVEDGAIVASGITESSVEVKGSAGSSFTVRWKGFWEHLDSIPVYSSYKSGQFGAAVRIGEDDTSWDKTLYSINTMRLIGVVLREAALNAADHGQDASWLMTDFGSDPSSQSAEWRKSYDLSTAQYATVGSIVGELLDDGECEPVFIEPQIVSGKMSWTISFQPERTVTLIDLDDDNGVGDVEFIDHISTTATRSFLRSEDRAGNTWISNVPYSSNTAYSAWVPDDTTTTVSGSRIQRANLNAVAAEENIAGQMTYRTFERAYARVGARYEISSPEGAEIRAVCTESSYDGEGVYSATLTIISSSSALNRFRDPRSAVLPRTWRHLLLPASRNSRNTRKNTFGSSKRRTGWRNP